MLIFSKPPSRKVSKKAAKASQKISVLVIIQIVIILASFLTLQHFESEKVFLGNAVNIAGKDRFLTSDVLVKLHEYDAGESSKDDVVSSLDRYAENLQLLRNGGIMDDLTLQPLDPRFYQQWEIIHALFLEYDDKARSFVNSGSDNPLTIREISHIAENLVTHNDVLASDLGLEVQVLSSNLIWYEIIFAIVNVAVHLVMIWLIFRILKKDTEYWTKMERLYTIGEMAARLAHDLRNPLTVIKNSVGLLLLQTDGVEQSLLSRLKTIDRAALRMSRQIDDVMDFVRTRKPQLHEQSLRDVVVSALQTTEIPKTTHLNLPDKDVSIRCDRKQMEVLFSNLLSNAVQAIGDREGTVTIRIDDDLQDAIVEVEDSGPGIPEDVMPKIFEPLFTTKLHGTGLGLVSCKNIVDAHKGKITVQNKPTKFTVRIPKIID